MNKTSFITLFLFLFLTFSCKPYKGFREITNINVKAYPQRNISLELDTFDRRVRRYWRNSNSDEKKAFLKTFKESRIRLLKSIEADTSKITKVYVSAHENHIIFYGKSRNEFKNLNTKYEDVDFIFESMDSIYNKIEIGILDRNTGNSKVKIIFPNLKRFAILDLDTNYSSIHIYTSSIKSKLELELDSEINKNKVSNDSIYPIPNTIEIVNEEGIYIFYEIPSKYSPTVYDW